MHRCLTVPAPTLRLWVHCSRASDGLLPPRPYLVGYARWDTRSDRFLLARQSFQQLFSPQSALYAGSVVYPWPGTPKASALTARRAAQHVRLSSADDAYERLCILTILSSLAPSPPYAGRYIVASRFRCHSFECGSIVRGLRT